MTLSAIVSPLHEVKVPENLLESQQQQSGLNNNYFSIFNLNKSEGSHMKGGKKTKRTGKKIKPPTFKFKSLNHYFQERPKRDIETSSSGQNEQRIETRLA